MSIEALIFDVDGTLADTEEAHRTAFNAAFQRLRLGWFWGRRDYRELLNVAGGKERNAAHIASLDVAPPERKRLLERIGEIHAEKTRRYTEIVAAGGVPLREGVARLLHETLEAGCRLAIASTTTAANIDALLDTTLGPRGLDMFSVIACGDHVAAKKPAPDIYRLALANLCLGPECAIAVEDSPNGLAAAMGAGLWTLVTPTFWTADGDFEGAGLVLPNLGSADSPLNGEPGHSLHDHAWLSFNELERLARPLRPESALQTLDQNRDR